MSSSSLLICISPNMKCSCFKCDCEFTAPQDRLEVFSLVFIKGRGIMNNNLTEKDCDRNFLCCVSIILTTRTSFFRVCAAAEFSYLSSVCMMWLLLQTQSLSSPWVTSEENTKQTEVYFPLLMLTEDHFLFQLLSNHTLNFSSPVSSSELQTTIRDMWPRLMSGCVTQECVFTFCCSVRRGFISHTSEDLISFKELQTSFSVQMLFVLSCWMKVLSTNQYSF